MSIRLLFCVCLLNISCVQPARRRTRRAIKTVIVLALLSGGAVGASYWWHKKHEYRRAGRHPGAVGRHPGAVGRHPGAVGRHPGAVGRHPGAVGRHPGAVGRHPGLDPGSTPTSDIFPPSQLTTPHRPLLHKHLQTAVWLAWRHRAALQEAFEWWCTPPEYRSVKKESTTMPSIQDNPFANYVYVGSRKNDLALGAVARSAKATGVPGRT